MFYYNRNAIIVAVEFTNFIYLSIIVYKGFAFFVIRQENLVSMIIIIVVP